MDGMVSVNLSLVTGSFNYNFLITFGQLFHLDFSPPRRTHKPGMWPRVFVKTMAPAWGSLTTRLKRTGLRQGQRKSIKLEIQISIFFRLGEFASPNDQNSYWWLGFW